MRTEHRPPAGASGDEGSPAGLESLLKELRFDVRRIRGGLARIVRVEWLRLQLRGIDALFRAALALCLLGFCFASSVAAAFLIAHGIREALFGWSQAAWLGNLGAGLAILGIAIGAGLVLRTRLRNACLRKAKEDQSPDRNGHS